MVKFFECRGCGPSFELADETINRVAGKLAEGAEIRDESFYSYFYGVARNVFHEHLRSSDTTNEPVDSLTSRRHPSINPIDLMERRNEYIVLETRLACLDKCTGLLPPETRNMIISYYDGEQRKRIENRRRMAEGLGVPINSLRIRVHRIREKLEGCLLNCIAQTTANEMESLF
jgi:DNA-directed RNA polymerase specialized sigma24 family protein